MRRRAADLITSNETIERTASKSGKSFHRRANHGSVRLAGVVASSPAEQTTPRSFVLATELSARLKIGRAREGAAGLFLEGRLRRFMISCVSSTADKSHGSEGEPAA